MVTLLVVWLYLCSAYQMHAQICAAEALDPTEASPTTLAIAYGVMVMFAPVFATAMVGWTLYRHLRGEPTE